MEGPTESVLVFQKTAHNTDKNKIIRFLTDICHVPTITSHKTIYGGGGNYCPMLRLKALFNIVQVLF